ncbi:MAG: hypothetical protein EOP11_20125, partial [Proteobacteria bacterium]
MRKSLAFLGAGLLVLAGLLFFAESKRASSEGSAALSAIEEVLKAQNQSLAGRIFEGLGRADGDAQTLLARWRAKPKVRSYLADTGLAEPDAPKWSIVAGRRIRAAGVIDDALLEDALDAHQNAPERVALYQSKGKYYLFIKGLVEGAPYASAYTPEAFFATFRSADGIRAWLALRDGTVIFHPVARFIGTNASNLKPIAAGMQELARGSSAPYTSRYLGLEGSDALGAWTPLPSFGMLVASEWPKIPDSSGQASGLYWFAVTIGALSLLALGYAIGGRSGEQAAAPARAHIFDESRLDDDAMEYLEEVKTSAQAAVDLAEARGREAEEAIRERQDALENVGGLEWRARVTEEYLERVIPKATGQQVWEALAHLISTQAPEISVLVYRYSTSSFSLVPARLQSRAELPESAQAYLKDARIFIGDAKLLETLPRTEGFQRWNKVRERHMPLQRSEFRVHSLGATPSGTLKGAIILFFDERLNSGGELNTSLRLF